MKRKNPVVISLVLVAFCFTTTAKANLVITEIMSYSAHHHTNFDWWELTNTSSSSVGLTGYSWDDDTQIPGRNVFGNITIAAGESIIILEAYGDGLQAWENDWGIDTGVNVYGVTYFSGFSGLENSDGVFLYDASDALVTFAEYTSSTEGFSNEWDINGAFLDLSVIDENGAYQSSNQYPDVGSPGYAVPEPATIALLALGGLALRRKCRA
ncbi:hypothetical protein ES707_11982 [subsurface metagenome]